MIELSAKIELVEDNVISLGYSIDFNDVSSHIPKNQKIDIKSYPFIIGSSKIGDNHIVTKDKFDYFMTEELSDNEGNFDKTFKILVRGDGGENINSFSIAFDTNLNRFPRSVVVDGVEYFDNDAIYTFVGLNDQNDHVVEIRNWSVANSPMIITGIYSGENIIIDKKNVQNINLNVMQRGDKNVPSWGVISNNGSMSFRDNTYQVSDYAEANILTVGTPIDFYISNTVKKQKNYIGTYYASKWKYDANNKMVSVDFEDNLVTLQNQEYSGFDYNYNKRETSVLEVFNDITENLTLSFEITNGARLVMQNTKSKYLNMEKCSYWSALDKICKICGLYMWYAKGKIFVDIGE